jgi:hypothetical protein
MGRAQHPSCREHEGTAVSAKRGKPSALKLMKLAEAWAREVDEELELERGDIDSIVEAVRNAFDRRISGRGPKDGEQA